MTVLVAPGAKDPQLIDVTAVVQLLSEYTPTPTVFTVPVLEIVRVVESSPEVLTIVIITAIAEIVPIAILLADMYSP